MLILLISLGLGQSQANFLAFGLAWDFTKPKLPKARPKLGLSGETRAGTSLFKTYNLTPQEQIELDKILKENLDKGYI